MKSAINFFSSFFKTPVKRRHEEIEETLSSKRQKTSVDFGSDDHDVDSPFGLLSPAVPKKQVKAPAAASSPVQKEAKKSVDDADPVLAKETEELKEKSLQDPSECKENTSSAKPPPAYSDIYRDFLPPRPKPSEAKALEETEATVPPAANSLNPNRAAHGFGSKVFDYRRSFDVPRPIPFPSDEESEEEEDRPFDEISTNKNPPSEDEASESEEEDEDDRKIAAQDDVISLSSDEEDEDEEWNEPELDNQVAVGSRNPNWTDEEIKLLLIAVNDCKTYMKAGESRVSWKAVEEHYFIELLKKERPHETMEQFRQKYHKLRYRNQEKYQNLMSEIAPVHNQPVHNQVALRSRNPTWTDDEIKLLLIAANDCKTRGRVNWKAVEKHVCIELLKKERPNGTMKQFRLKYKYLLQYDQEKYQNLMATI